MLPPTSSSIPKIGKSEKNVESSSSLLLHRAWKARRWRLCNTHQQYADYHASDCNPDHSTVAKLGCCLLRFRWAPVWLGTAYIQEKDFFVQPPTGQHKEQYIFNRALEHAHVPERVHGITSVATRCSPKLEPLFGRRPMPSAGIEEG